VKCEKEEMLDVPGVWGCGTRIVCELRGTVYFGLFCLFVSAQVLAPTA